MGADIILIDDPLKPDDARRAARKSANDWLDNTLLSRLNNKQEGAIVIIMQRLHLDDLVGHNYKKEGIMLTDISPISMVQGDLLEPLAAGDNRLMKAIDGLNSRFGRGTIKVSTGGIRGEWGMRQERKSPNYTTYWSELPAV